MAQPSVAREPSMEEILASIRRIIESNEPGAAKDISSALPPVYVADDSISDIHLTVDEDLADTQFDDVVAAVPAPDPRFVAANSPGAAREPEAPVVTLSLADVAARVRAASERNAAANAFPQREAPQPRELPPAMAARLTEASREPIAPPMRAVSVAEPAPVAASFEPAPQPALQSVPVIRAVEFEEPALRQVAVPPVPPVSSDDVPVVAVQPSREPARDAAVQEQEAAPLAAPADLQPALLSEAAGDQVARSFEVLAAAIEDGERRSMDEIAQDMLRPMLQEWLDDNLPTLVERLVREEIERVARGPRR